MSMHKGHLMAAKITGAFLPGSCFVDIPVSSPAPLMTMIENLNTMSLKAAFFYSCNLAVTYSQKSSPVIDNFYVVDILPPDNIYVAAGQPDYENFDVDYCLSVSDTAKRAALLNINIKFSVTDRSLTDNSCGWEIDNRHVLSFSITLFGMTEAVISETETARSLSRYKSSNSCDKYTDGRMVCILNQYFKL